MEHHEAMMEAVAAAAAAHQVHSRPPPLLSLMSPPPEQVSHSSPTAQDQSAQPQSHSQPQSPQQVLTSEERIAQLEAQVRHLAEQVHAIQYLMQSGGRVASPSQMALNTSGEVDPLAQTQQPGSPSQQQQQQVQTPTAQQSHHGVNPHWPRNRARVSKLRNTAPINTPEQISKWLRPRFDACRDPYKRNKDSYTNLTRNLKTALDLDIDEKELKEIVVAYFQNKRQKTKRNPQAAPPGNLDELLIDFDDPENQRAVKRMKLEELQEVQIQDDQIRDAQMDDAQIEIHDEQLDPNQHPLDPQQLEAHQLDPNQLDPNQLDPNQLDPHQLEQQQLDPQPQLDPQ